MIVTAPLFQAYLECPTKCWLRLHAESATGNVYAEWVRAQNDLYRLDALNRLRALFATREQTTAPSITKLTRATTAESRAYCATHARLFGELAGAVETDRHLASIERVRQQIKDALASRKSSMADFEVALIARILKADKDAVELIRAVGRAVAIDLVGVAFLTLVWANHPETGTSGSSRSLRTTRRWWRRKQRQDVQADSAIGTDKTSAKAAPSSTAGFPPVSADRPRNLATRPPKKGAALVPSAQVLTFPRTTLPNASNDVKSGDRDDYGEGRQAPHHVIGATAIAIVPPRIEEPIHRPSTLAGDNSSEHKLETAGDIFPAFDREHLERIEGASASASEICAALQAWCAKRAFKVPSQKRLGLYLAGLGFHRWKSNGKMHYQDVRLKVICDNGATSMPL
jgi:hypothetical protein